MSSNIVSFKQFITESISLVRTPYGTDDECSNMQFKEASLGGQTLRVAYFKHDDSKVKVILYGDGTFAFSVQSKTDDKKWILHPSKTEFSIKNVFTFYGKIWYIACEMIQKLGATHITFTASEPRLIRIYDAMWTSPSFMRVLGDNNLIITKPDAATYSIHTKEYEPPVKKKWWRLG